MPNGLDKQKIWMEKQKVFHRQRVHQMIANIDAPDLAGQKINIMANYLGEDWKQETILRVDEIIKERNKLKARRWWQ